ncbi:uncharacterized protein LOC129588510 [Paramacrobiotus metropolitanus]|uniref:uncharacterized protein LOC129588510 n=1 Tax=Paramacrobiotus metropolitanus TaxID=2943436 RepID=UPI002445D8E2|nr:uncharacterized protein LOC129588510 [Paramacrobiotus metropolitanus]
MVCVMNPNTSATLGDPEFPPKNGVIIKQGHLFVQETKKLLFMKWKVWRKRWICLRYLSNNATPVLQIDTRNAVHTSQNLLNLSQESQIEMIDYSGQQDLASAKALQLTLDTLSEPLLFKHPSQTEMTDWMAAFRLTVALGETGSICSDTDSSIWNDSQAAASPVSSGSPINPFSGAEVPPLTYTVRVRTAKASPLAEKLGFVFDQEYEVRMSPQDVAFHSADGNHEIMPVQIALLHMRKIYLESSSGNPDVVPNSDLVCIETTRQSPAGEGVLKLETANPHDLTHHLRTLLAGPTNIKKILADQERLSVKSRTSRRSRPVSERPRKRPLSFMGNKGRFSTEQTSPVAGRAPRLTNRENSVRSMTGLRNFQHMDSRDSEHSSTGTSEAVSGASSLNRIAQTAQDAGLAGNSSQ